MIHYRTNYKAAAHVPKDSSARDKPKPQPAKPSYCNPRSRDVTRQCEEIFLTAPDMSLREFRALCAHVEARPTSINTVYYRLRAKHAGEAYKDEPSPQEQDCSSGGQVLQEG